MRLLPLLRCLPTPGRAEASGVVFTGDIAGVAFFQVVEDMLETVDRGSA
jgi:hypothetical protein